MIKNTKLLLITGAISLTSCGTSYEQVNVTTSMYPHYDLVRQTTKKYGYFICACHTTGSRSPFLSTNTKTNSTNSKFRYIFLLNRFNRNLGFWYECQRRERDQCS